MRPPISWTLLILAVALLLRLDGLSHGLHLDDPMQVELGSQRDERAMAQAVLDGPLSGSADPGIFLHWGSGGFWTFGLLDLSVVGLAALVGSDDLTQTWRENPSGILLLHRLASAAAGLLTVLVLLRAAARERGSRTALCAAALLATCYLHVRESHVGSLDVLLTLWITLAWDQSLAWLAARRQDGTSQTAGRRHALRAGLALGLATATKTIGALGFGLPLLAWWLGRPRRGDQRRSHGANISLLGALLAGAGTLALLSPHLLWALDDVTQLLRENSARFAAGPGDLPAALSEHLTNSLGVGLGWVTMALAVVGAAALLAERDRRARCLLWLTLWPCLFLVAFRLTATRYALPLLPGLCLLAAVGIESLTVRLGSLRPRASGWALGALMMAAMALPLRRSLSFGRLLRAVDTRIDVAATLREAGAQRDDVLAFGLYGLPAMHPGARKAPWVSFLGMRARQGDAAREGVLAHPPRFMLHERSHHALDAKGWDLFAELVAQRYERVLRLDGRSDRATPALPDETTGNPSFFVPWARPWLMQRPGPALDLYRLRDD